METRARYFASPWTLCNTAVTFKFFNSLYIYQRCTYIIRNMFVECIFILAANFEVDVVISRYITSNNCLAYTRPRDDYLPRKFYLYRYIHILYFLPACCMIKKKIKKHWNKEIVQALTIYIHTTYTHRFRGLREISPFYKNASL